MQKRLRENAVGSESGRGRRFYEGAKVFFLKDVRGASALASVSNRGIK